MHVAGVIEQDALSLTWHPTLHLMLSVAWQLSPHSVAQTVVGGDALHEYEH